MKKLNIRWRLTLWNSLAVAGLLVLCGGLVYVFLRQAMYEQTDRLLASQFDELRQDRRMASAYQERLPHWVHEFKEHVNVFAVVYDSSGHVFARTDGLADEAVRAIAATDGAEQRLASQDVPTLGMQRTLSGQLDIGEATFSVALMAPLAEVLEDLQRVFTVLVSALPIGLVLAGGLGYWLSRTALAPIEQLRQRADGITAERLSQRLPVGNPHDELGRLTQTFNEMIARLERSFSQMRRFTADASHELRTPLAVLRTEAEIALGKPLDGEHQQRLLTSILEECHRLTGLTDQLLTLARDDAGTTQYERQEVDLAALVTDVVETMKALAEVKQQRVNVQVMGQARITGDASRLRQVFYNLLDNAIKYTPNDGRIEVEVAPAADSIAVTVRDTGMGIPIEHVPHVFERFYRVDKARSRSEGGFGLGLSIAQSIVAAHGGQIELESEPARGTTCTVELPSAKKPE